MTRSGHSACLRPTRTRGLSRSGFMLGFEFVPVGGWVLSAFKAQYPNLMERVSESQLLKTPHILETEF